MEARAVVLASVVQNADSTYTYNYTIDNSLGAFDVSFFSLEFDYSIFERDWNPVNLLAGGDVVTPLQDSTNAFDDWQAGDGVPVTGQFAQDFFAVGPLGQGDVLVGETLSGFSFTSSLGPGQVTVTEFGPLGQSSTGFTTGPVLFVVPEPTTSLFLLLTSTTFVWRRKRLRS